MTAETPIDAETPRDAVAAETNQPSAASTENAPAVQSASGTHSVTDAFSASDRTSASDARNVDAAGAPGNPDLPNAASQSKAPNAVPQTSYYVYRDRHSDGTVGFFTIIGLMLLFGSYCWWKSFSPLHPYQRFHVRFHDVAGMNQQAAVFVNGVRVGSVETIDIIDTSTVDVGVRISTTKVRIQEGSQFMILPNGVVGAKYVEILLPAATKTATYLTDKSVSWGQDPVRPEIVVNELAEKLSGLDFDAVQEKLSKGMDRMTVAADRVSTLSRKLEPAADKLAPIADRAAIAEDTVTALAKDMRAPVQQMHQMMDQKHPLLHMIFGRPGHIKEQKQTEATTQTTTTTSGSGAVQQKTKTQVPTSSDEAQVSDKKAKRHKKHHHKSDDQ